MCRGVLVNGPAIQELRNQRNLTQADLAKLAKVSTKTIQNAEKPFFEKRLDNKIVTRIANALECRFEKLIFADADFICSVKVNNEGVAPDAEAIERYRAAIRQVFGKDAEIKILHITQDNSFTVRMRMTARDIQVLRQAIEDGLFANVGQVSIELDDAAEGPIIPPLGPPTAVIPPVAIPLGPGATAVEFERSETELSASDVVFNAGDGGSVGSQMASVSAQWIDAKLQVWLGGFLGKQTDDAWEVTWKLPDGREKASGSPANQFVDVVELTPSDATPPEAGEKLCLHHRRAGEADWDLSVDVFFVRDRETGKLHLSRDWLTAAIDWTPTDQDQDTIELAGALATALSLSTSLQPIGLVARSDSDTPDAVSFDDLITKLAAGESLTLSSENVTIYIQVVESGITLRADAGAARGINDFSIEFRRGGAVLLAQSARRGVLEISTEQIHALRQRQVDLVIIRH